jgi:hypothetical protein
MVDAGYRPSYIRSAFTLLSGVLRGAVAARLIAEAPLEGIDLPSVKRKREADYSCVSRKGRYFGIGHRRHNEVGFSQTETCLVLRCRGIGIPSVPLLR